MGTFPYENLFVYEVDGAILGARDFFKDDFIGCWNEGDASFLFFSTSHDEEVQAFIKKKRLRLLSRNVMDYGSWQAGEELKPFRVGNLLFCPPWETGAPQEEEILIHLDPCVVFGTGFHPTTRSCLKALWELYRREKPKKVLDLGTGSGILALAAAKWGAQRVLAIDCNELAVDTALRNVKLNQESTRIEVKVGNAEEFIDEEADLVCANLHFQVIESLLKKESLFEKRWIMLSGLFAKDAREIERELNRRTFRTYMKIEERNWATWVGINAKIE